MPDVDENPPDTILIAEDPTTKGQELNQLLNSSPSVPTAPVSTVEEPPTLEDAFPTSPLKMVSPRYPKGAQQLGIEGTVVLRARVDKRGKVLSVNAISGNPQLVDEASEAVKQWVYPPAMVNGKPVEVDREIQLQFKLK